MNIFASDPSPIKSAAALDDLRLNKMILESAQLLSNAVHAFVPDLSPLVYKKVSFWHPCAKWVRVSRANYDWLLTHFTALLFEKLYRTQNVHSSMLLLDIFREAKEAVPEGTLTEFANCSMFKEEAHVCTAYRKTLLKKWLAAKVPQSRTWTLRQPPSWLKGTITTSGKLHILEVKKGED